MRKSVVSVWSLILMGGIVQIAGALQADLLAVRAVQDAFSSWTIGIITAGFYVGYSCGPVAAPALIRRFGPVRTIVVGLSVAALTILLCGIFVAPLPWMGLRLASGFAISAAFVACESWINFRVDNRVRGRVFSLYLVMQMTGMTAAQLLFQAGGAKSLALFAIAGAIFLVGAAPVIAAAKSAPNAAPPEPFDLIGLFAVSPLGALVTIYAGVTWSILFAFGPVYAQREGFGTDGVSLMMALALAAGAFFQFPLGWLSDHAGRERTIGLMSVCAIAVALFGVWAEGHGTPFKFAAAALAGGFIFPLYGIAVAQTNDHVSASQRVAVAAGLLLLFGLGSIMGPLIAGGVFSLLGPAGFFEILAGVMTLCLATTAIRR